ncbi:MAG: S53 family peptidase [Candidatus Velthaea sp.]
MPIPRGEAQGVRTIVHLPLRNQTALNSLIAAQSTRGSAQYRHFITPQQFADQYGPTAADVKTAGDVLKAEGFKTYATSQGLVADAPQAVVERTFQTKVRSVLAVGRATQAASAVVVPASLQKLGATVAILPNFVAKSLSVKTDAYPDGALPTPDDRYGPSKLEYWFTDLKEAYGYPSVQIANGAGKTIGIVMSDTALQSDLQAYFQHENYTLVSGKPAPAFEVVPVDGGANPATGLGAEVALDIQMSLGSAPGANLVLYNTPDLSFGHIYDAYYQLIQENRVDIVSSSFGLGEKVLTAAYQGGQDFTSIITKDFHDLFVQGNAQGITFVASSGDGGGNGCADPSGTTAVPCVSWPADDPNVTAVGGTNLVTTSLPKTDPTSPYPFALTSQYVRENANDDPLASDIFCYSTCGAAIPGEVWGSGGGDSVLFDLPAFQSGVPTRGSKGRMVPDISMHMGGCPRGAVRPCGPDRSFDVVYIGGRRYGLIGTSASAPEFAGLLAITEAAQDGRLGNANNYIYSLVHGNDEKGAYRHRIPGNNGVYSTQPVYDKVLGVGTPKAAIFAGFDEEDMLAGDPQTPSNP